MRSSRDDVDLFGEFLLVLMASAAGKGGRPLLRLSLNLHTLRHCYLKLDNSEGLSVRLKPAVMALPFWSQRPLDTINHVKISCCLGSTKDIFVLKTIIDHNISYSY